MHIYTLHKWQHGHEFTRVDTSNETRTLRVVILTAVMMGLEIAGGMYYGSMALLADGWHMGTHAAALGIALFAYGYELKKPCRKTPCGISLTRWRSIWPPLPPSEHST